MSDDEERDRRGRFERNRSPQRNRSRSRSRERRNEDSGALAEQPGPDDPPATLFVAELPLKLQIGALEKLCVEMPVRRAFGCTCAQPRVALRLSTSHHLLALGAGVHEQPPAHRSWWSVRRIHRIQFWHKCRSCHGRAAGTLAFLVLLFHSQLQLTGIAAAARATSSTQRTRASMSHAQKTQAVRGTEADRARDLVILGKFYARHHPAPSSVDLGALQTVVQFNTRVWCLHCTAHLAYL